MPRATKSRAASSEGLRFYQSISPHLTAIEDATIEAGGSSTKVRGRLRVNVDAGIGQFVLTPGLGPFLTRYPDLSMEIAVRDRMGDLVRDGFDVAVRFGLPEPSALKSRLLMRTRVVTCASAEYVARHGMPTRPSDIERHQCLLMRDHTSGRLFEWSLFAARRSFP